MSSVVLDGGLPHMVSRSKQFSQLLQVAFVQTRYPETSGVLCCLSLRVFTHGVQKHPVSSAVFQKVFGMNQCPLLFEMVIDRCQVFRLKAVIKRALVFRLKTVIISNFFVQANSTNKWVVFR